MDNRRAPLFAGLAVAGVAILMVLLLVLPKMGQVSQAQVQLDQAQRDQQTLESRKSALEDAKAAAVPQERARRREGCRARGTQDDRRGPQADPTHGR